MKDLLRAIESHGPYATWTIMDHAREMTKMKDGSHITPQGLARTIKIAGKVLKNRRSWKKSCER